MTMPLIFESGQHGERAYDVFSKLMTQRVIFLIDEIEPQTANIICAQLNYLDSTGDGAPIHMYINSPGGDVVSTLVIYDTMQYIRSPVHTLCVGRACSGAAVLLLAGAKGKRRLLKHSDVMLHQPSGAVMGQVTNMNRGLERINRLKKSAAEIVVAHTGQTEDWVNEALEWDYFLTPDECLKFGIADEIITKRKQIT